MPLANQLHVDALLSNVSVKYKNGEYIADQVFPSVPVKKESDLFRVYSRNFKIPETKRAPKAVAREFSMEVSNSSYLVESHALKDYVGADEAMNYDLGDLRADVTEELTDAIMRMKEKKVADLFVAANWSLSVSLAAAGAWSSNSTASNPISLIDTATTTIIANSGVKPNFGIIPRAGFVQAKNHVSIADRVKYTSSDMTKEMLAGLFDLEQLLVPVSSYDSAADGLAEVIAPIWGDNAFVGFKPASPGPRQVSAGYTFEQSIPRVRRWKDEERNAEAIEVAIKFQPKVVASLCGYLIIDLVQ